MISANSPPDLGWVGASVVIHGDIMRVVICGGGVIGACTAYFLRRRGIDVTVVERTEVAAAASGKAGGFLALDWCAGTPLDALARRSFPLHAHPAPRDCQRFLVRRRVLTRSVCFKEGFGLRVFGLELSYRLRSISEASYCSTELRKVRGS
jgi:glycine/D-amino acid oxidase-like deaminating enzyme